MSTTTDTDLLSEVSEGVLTLTLNRPDTLNSLTPGVLDGIRAGVESAAEDPEIRCIVLGGTGRAFSSGASLKDSGGAFDPEPMLLEHYNPTIMAMQKIEKPILASIHGIAAGAGASVALACDFRIWADDARMALLFTRIGLVPDAGATYLLPRIIGVARAMEMLMLGEDVHAEKALDWGLAHRVVPAADLAAETRAYAERLAALPRASGMVKRLMRKTMSLSLPEQMKLEARMQDEAGKTADFAEGVTAFMEKRPSQFSGR
ncbi:MAG: 2-(1,2-epoxy,2-dihydrophenyl)acetyl-CoA isomerase [Solirubrobacteraceae bacterium]|nr:2-(1,2-epoxy,2-dihydrophenyl)acetyl-CoA isomerase [Solirubrobacteraceae bacterium]